MLDISRRRGRGVSPMRPHIRREFALAIIWAEAALELAGGEDQQIRWIEEGGGRHLCCLFITASILN